MSKPKWVVREAARDDAAGIQSLFRKVFHFDRDDSAYIWKFWGNDARSIITVAEAEGRIIGHCALWGAPLRIGGERVLGAQAVDIMTDPDYQRQGMFVALAEAAMELAAEQGIELLYGFPNSNAYPGWINRLGWTHSGNVGMWVRPLKPSKHKRIPPVLGTMADSLSNLIPKGSSQGYEIANEAPSDCELDRFLDEWGETSRVCQVDRTRSRLRWRFSPEAGLNHQWISVNGCGGKPHAFATWGLDPQTGNAVLSEVMGLSLPARIGAVSAAVANAGRAGHPIMLSITNDEDLIPAMRRCGFFRFKDAPFITRQLSQRTFGVNARKWRIQASDLDAY
jgi:GNAT superfamily N-acetyltransferase